MKSGTMLLDEAGGKMVKLPQLSIEVTNKALYHRQNLLKHSRSACSHDDGH
jgi:hypothetical protein